MKLVEILLLVLIGLTPLGQLARINLGENIFFYPNDILIPVILSLWLFYRIFVTKKFFLTKLAFVFAGVILWAIIGLTYAIGNLGNQELLISSLYLVRLILYMSLMLVSYDLVKHGRSRKLLIFMTIVSLVVAVLGFVQLVIVPDFSAKAATEGWDPHQFRLLSTFYDPNFVGGFLSMGLALSLAGFLKYADRRIFFAVSCIVTSIAIVLTFSRSAYLAALIVVLVIAVIKMRKLLLLLPVVLVLVTLFAPRALDRVTESIQPGTSGYYRIISWDHALTIAQDNLAFGTGYNTYRYAQESYNFITHSESLGGNPNAGTDSSLLLILVTMGIPGLVLWGGFFGLIGWTAFRAYRSGSAWGLALMAILPALLAHSLFLNSFFYQWIMLYFWIIVGASDAERKID